MLSTCGSRLGRRAEGVPSRVIDRRSPSRPALHRGSGRHARAEHSQCRWVHPERLPDRRDRPRGCEADAGCRPGGGSQHLHSRGGRGARRVRSPLGRAQRLPPAAEGHHRRRVGRGEFESPLRGFSRIASRDTHTAQGARVWTLIGSANRDERKWERPDEFDFRRNPLDQPAFSSADAAARRLVPDPHRQTGTCESSRLPSARAPQTAAGSATPTGC